MEERGTEVPKCSSLGATGGRRSFPGEAPGASKFMCNSCKESHDYAKGH